MYRAMYKTGDRVMHKESKRYGVILRFKDFGFQHQIIKVKFDDGELMEVSNLSGFTKVIVYPTK